MRFVNYITEENVKIDDLSSFLKSNCKPFLKEFRKSYIDGDFIFRGSNHDVRDARIFKVRKDRKPRLVSKEAHNFLSSISKKLFGWNMRGEGSFTGSAYVAASYGTTNIFIPIGNYKYVYTEDTGNLYGYYDKLTYAFDADEDWQKERLEKYWEERPEERKKGDVESEEDLRSVKEKIELIYKNDYKTKNLNKVLKKPKWEAVFKCDRYLMISREYKEKLIEELKEGL